MRVEGFEKNHSVYELHKYNIYYYIRRTLDQIIDKGNSNDITSDITVDVRVMEVVLTWILE